MKINRLDHTKSLFPHFYDKTDDSNFTKHLKVVGEPQWDIRHKLKTIEWSRILEKPLQIWKEQTQSYVYDMHFKVIVPFLKQVNIYKNPVISADEEVVGYDELCSTESFPYEDRVRLYEKKLSDLTSVHRIPKDTYLLEIYTWDDYHFLKGYPENDYTVKEDNILEWRYNESFLSINIEEISYSKYLTFRVHKDKIKQIRIYKNDSLLLNELFDMDIIANSKSTDLSYYYSDDDFTNENTYLQSDFHSHFEVEDAEHNHVKIYVVDTDVDEYVFRLALSDDDFEDGVLKDTYDLEVTTFEKRYRCRQEYDKVYSKRYCGYDEQLNDCFDHDYSLDMIGRLLNVHRFRFYQVYRADDYYLSRTYPTYYDRATEDDYHYMKRMQFYISNYNHIVFPVLEFWKYYHTMATIRSRKRIVDEMDYAYLRTNVDDCYIDFDGVEEEFESETVTEYSINKATLTSGESIMVTVEDSVWHEATIVKDVYVVPDVNYRLRFGVKDNSEDVTVRMICYNRQGVELRTTPVLEEDMQTSDHEYTSSDGYSYNDLLVVIPSDTVSVKMVLESNGSFSFADATFERMTVVNFDNYYMGTDEDYNSNVYELYCVYEDLPTNLRIGGDRFNILFKRSLPLTKRGFFLVDINEEKTTYVEATTNLELYVKNILMGNETSGVIGTNDDYDVTVDYLIKANNTYNLSYFVKSLEDSTIYEPNYDEVLFDSDDAFVDVFNDNGTTASHNDHWYINSYGTATVQSDGTKLLNTSGNTSFVMRSTIPSDKTITDANAYSYNPSYIVEFDIVETDGTSNSDAQVQIYSEQSNNNFAQAVTTGHYKIQVTSEEQKIWVDDTLIKTTNLSLPNARITLRVRNGKYLIYKDFKVTEFDKTKYPVNTPVTFIPNDKEITIASDRSNGAFVFVGILDQYIFTGDFSVEFDVTDVSNDKVWIRIEPQGATTYFSKNMTHINNLQPCNVKLVKIGRVVRTFVDGVEKPNLKVTVNSDEDCRVYFRYTESSSISFKNLKIAPLEYVPIIDDDELVFTTVTYYGSDNNEIESEEMEQKIYSNIESHISHHFTTPTDTSKIKITISSETSAELSDIQLSRMEELTDDEVYINGN